MQRQTQRIEQRLKVIYDLEQCADCELCTACTLTDVQEEPAFHVPYTPAMIDQNWLANAQQTRQGVVGRTISPASGSPWPPGASAPRLRGRFRAAVRT